MRFSLILASRDRISLLRGLLDSLMRTTSQPNQIEILAVFDNDDTNSVKAMSELSQKYQNINARFWTRERTEWMHRDYINWVYPHSRGKYVIVLNDDTRFINPGWDDQAYGKLEGYLADKSDGVVYGFTDNMTKDANLCCFPLFSRQAIDSLGFVLPNERKNWSADRDIYEVYTHPLVNRKLDLPEIKIEHVAYHAGLRGRDAVSFRVEQIFHREPRIDIPVASYASKIASHRNDMKAVVNDRKVLAVFNICGISGKENTTYYLSAINSLLHQKFDGMHVVISGCLSSQQTKMLLSSKLGDRVSYNWIDDKLPLGVTFNHTVRKCIDEFGAFESYLYVDSGVNFSNNRYAVQTLYDMFKSDNYGMVSAQTDTDTGYGQWGIKIEGDFVIPLGKAVNLHCQLFSHDIYEKYHGKILPDIFAHHTSESTFTFLNSAIGRKWGISGNVILHHEISMDGPSSGFLKGTLLFNAPTSIERICEMGRPHGFGYEECRRICVHDPSKFTEDGYALSNTLFHFLDENLYLKKDHFNYDNIISKFVNKVKIDVNIPSPNVSCILVSHNKPQYVTEAVQSVINQEHGDWELIIVDSGVLLGQGFFSYINDPRIKVLPSGETDTIRAIKAMAPWCFNQCLKFVKGHLITYLCDDDIFYPNAFGVFVDHVRKNPHIHAMYGSQDISIHRDGQCFSAGERRALVTRGVCVNGAKLDCQVDYLQLCHTKEMLNWLPDKNAPWPEWKGPHEHHADGIFMESIGQVVPIYPIDVKVSQNRRTPVSTYKPVR